MLDVDFKIHPNKGIVAVCIACVVISFFLIFNKPVSIGRFPPPEILLLISLQILHQEWRTILIKKGTIVIQYHVIPFRRRIAADRITHIEFTKVKSHRFLLITLDNCPSLSKSKCKHANVYRIVHPFRVIAIRCSDSGSEPWEAYFSEGG